MPTFIPFVVSDDLFGLTCSICGFHLARRTGETKSALRLRIEAEHAQMACLAPDLEYEAAARQYVEEMMELVSRCQRKAARYRRGAKRRPRPSTR